MYSIRFTATALCQALKWNSDQIHCKKQRPLTCLNFAFECIVSALVLPPQ